jgi:lysophospholipase L1-like esterase
MAQAFAGGALGQLFDEPLAELFGLSSLSPPSSSANATLKDQSPPAPTGPPAAPGGIWVTNILPDGRTNIVLRSGPSGRRFGPRKPPFELKDGERILMIGDGLIAGEAKYGYLETRMTSQYPDRNLRFRVLGAAAENPLTQPAGAVAKDKPADDWLKQLLSPLAGFKPTVVLVGYGMAASFAGDAGLPNFKANYHRLLEALKSPDTNSAVRFILLSPIHHEILPDEPEPTAHNLQLDAYAKAIKEEADQRGAEFADLFAWTRADAQAAKARSQQRNLRIPPLTERGTNLTAYGYLRISLALDHALRWTPNNWRFGLGRESGLRRGGFGANILQHERSERHARVVMLEERLPTPNAPGYLDLEEGAKPQCYIQIPGFEPGRYTLKVDGKPVLTGTDAEWGRYEVISEGPQWEQAEELRKTIVNKNELVAQSWRQPKEGVPPENAGLASQIAELEDKIATLRRPVKRTLEVVQVEKLPAPPKPEELVKPLQPPKPVPPPKPKPDASLPPPPNPPGLDIKPPAPPAPPQPKS